MRTKSPSLITSRLSAYFGFTGVDRSRPVIGMDDGKKQPLFELHNGHAKWTGTLVRDAGLKLRTRVEEGEVIHQDFFKISIDNNLSKLKIEWNNKKCITIVLCAKGYPGKYKKN